MSLAPSDFAHAVLRVVASIPRGQVLTYGEVAAEASRPGAARAVGAVLRRHGADVPWWRVVPADGRLAPHLAAEQQRRLRDEGVEVTGGHLRSPPPHPRG